MPPPQKKKTGSATIMRDSTQTLTGGGARSSERDTAQRDLAVLQARKLKFETFATTMDASDAYLKPADIGKIFKPHAKDLAEMKALQYLHDLEDDDITLWGYFAHYGCRTREEVAEKIAGDYTKSVFEKNLQRIIAPDLLDTKIKAGLKAGADRTAKLYA